MGPRGLNKFLKNQTIDGMQEINLQELSGKKIVVDTSIYMYRYNTNNELIENFYAMLCIFKKYNIIPLFIFDGKPPPEKYDALIKRRDERKEAENIYNLLAITPNAKPSILKYYKRKKTTINNKNLLEVKELFDYYGVMYIDALREADELCAYYVLSGQAWACLSDDMDLLMYKCPRIIKYFSILNESAVLYTIDNILRSLNISYDIFMKICILSGTDYNIHHYLSIEKIYKHYINFKKKFQTGQFKEFLEWLNINGSVDEIETTQKVFQLVFSEFANFNIVVEFKKQNITCLRQFMESYDFIFL